ncbi:hypothetical protein [Thalassolituus sp. UBA1505]|uniref:hypothetical protein n=1 Tax=Thalassolituus sp. UBA1505 TaxID=1947653 RepID=UPI0025CD0F61|nr:hypothetical protein [Thalassolituus sp. UBA1505]|tara:strand:+ start:1064 stop:1705 length:642 start_codon:yes stop_codon:yes gene_type:complete
MRSGVVSWLCGALVAVAATAQAWAFDGKYREIDWNEQLDLSLQQSEQIQAIEKKYHEQMYQLVPDKPESKRKDGETRAEVQRLMTDMRNEMRAVLTPDQLQKAHTLMLEQHSKMRLRMARRLAMELDMPIEQEHRLQQQVSSMEDDYDWPMDKKQLDEDRDKFKAVLKSVLTEEQQATLAERRKEARERWQSARERGFPEGEHMDNMPPPPER